MTRSSIARDVAIAVLAACVFLWLASVVTPLGPPPAFDITVRAGVHSWASPALTVAMKAVTTLGNPWCLFPIGAVLVILLAREGRRRQADLLAVSVAGAYLLESGIKLAYQRPRPEPFFNYPLPGSYSFPSGHALIGLSFYCTLAAVLVARDWSPGRKAAVWAAAIVMTLWTGLSRIYLGVHYPTDVVGGYVAAIGWIAIVHAGLIWSSGLQTNEPPVR